MEQRINSATWVLSALALLLLVMAVYVPTGHTVAIIVIAVICLFISGIVYYGGNAIIELKKKRNEK